MNDNEQDKKNDFLKTAKEGVKKAIPPKVNIFTSIRNRFKIDLSFSKGAINSFKETLKSKKSEEDLEELKKNDYDFILLLKKWQILPEDEKNIETIDDPRLDIVIEEAIDWLKDTKKNTFVVIIALSLFFFLPQVYFIFSKTDFSFSSIFSLIATIFILILFYVKYLSFKWREDVLINRRFILFKDWIKEVF